jgi:hypothetical protein
MRKFAALLAVLFVMAGSTASAQYIPPGFNYPNAVPCAITTTAAKLCRNYYNGCLVRPYYVTAGYAIGTFPLNTKNSRWFALKALTSAKNGTVGNGSYSP